MQINKIDSMQNIRVNKSAINNIQNTIFINESIGMSNYQNMTSNPITTINDINMNVDYDENICINQAITQSAPRKMLTKIWFPKFCILYHFFWFVL